MQGNWISNVRHLALLYTGALILAACIFGTFLYIVHQDNSYLESKAAIRADVQGFIDIYTLSNDINVVKHTIEERLKKHDVTSFYSLYNHLHQVLASNIKELPPMGGFLDDDFIFYEIPHENVSGREHFKPALFHSHYDVLAMTIQLGPDEHNGLATLIVGRDIDTFQTSQGIIEALAWISIGLIAVLALICFLMTFTLTQRVRLIQSTTTNITQTGDLSSRIEMTQVPEDFKPIAQTFNTMLERIEELVNGIRQVSDNIAHDLRTPLTRLRHNVDSLKRGDDSVSIDDISTETDRIITTFNALLRIANIEQGKRSAGFSDINVNTLLKDIYEYYELLAQKRSQHLEIKLPEQSIFIKGDKDLLFQALSNMLENALKFTPDNGQISIKATLIQERVQIIISDTGCGISDEDKLQVFQRFFRVDSSRHTAGNGLGLSLVKAVVDLHNAEITLDNNQPSGLTINLFFPALLRI